MVIRVALSRAVAPKMTLYLYRLALKMNILTPFFLYKSVSKEFQFSPEKAISFKVQEAFLSIYRITVL